MKMKIVLRTIVVMLLLIMSLHIFVQAQAQKKLLAAPDIVPPATEAMQHPEFWISRINGDPDQVIMTPEEIAKLDKKNRSRPLEWKDINGTARSFDPVLSSGNFLGIHYYREDPLKIQSISGDLLKASATQRQSSSITLPVRSMGLDRDAICRMRGDSRFRNSSCSSLEIVGTLSPCAEQISTARAPCPPLPVIIPIFPSIER